MINMKKYDLAINNINLIDARGEIKEDKSLAIKDGIICLIEDRPVEDAVRIIDGRGKYLSPSFANLHSHSPMNFLKSLAEDANIDQWFNNKIWPYESSLEEEDIYLGAKLAIYEMINNGITVFADHYFFEEEIIRAVEELGVRADIAPTVFSDLGDIDAAIERTLALKDKYQSNKLSLSFGPHSTYMCSDKDLEKIADQAQKNQMKVHLHLAETQEQVVDHKKKYGERPLETLKRVGLLDGPVLIGHGLFIEEDEYDLLSDKHHIALCPKTYMKLAMDMDQVLEAEKRKAIYGFGTDGGASSNSLNVLEQAQLFGLMGKYHLQDASKLTVNELWKRLMDSHKYFGFKTGDIAEEMAADLIIWDLDRANTLPVHHVLATIIYSSNAENIEYLLCDGKIIKEGEVNLDQDFISRLKLRKERFLKVGKSKTKLKF